MKHEVGTKVYVALSNEMQEGIIYAAIQGDKKYAIKLDNGNLMFAAENQVVNFGELAKQSVEKAEKERDLRAGGTVSIQDKGLTPDLSIVDESEYLTPSTNRINCVIDESRANLGSAYSRLMDIHDTANDVEKAYIESLKSAIIDFTKTLERYRQSD